MSDAPIIVFMGTTIQPVTMTVRHRHWINGSCDNEISTRVVEYGLDDAVVEQAQAIRVGEDQIAIGTRWPAAEVEIELVLTDEQWTLILTLCDDDELLWEHEEHPDPEGARLRDELRHLILQQKPHVAPAADPVPESLVDREIRVVGPGGDQPAHMSAWRGERRGRTFYGLQVTVDGETFTASGHDTMVFALDQVRMKLEREHWIPVLQGARRDTYDGPGYWEGGLQVPVLRPGTANPGARVDTLDDADSDQVATRAEQAGYREQEETAWRLRHRTQEHF